eukprot:jgi/Botrbrau1/22130/Bobra.0206s0054.1
MIRDDLELVVERCAPVLHMACTYVTYVRMAKVGWLAHAYGSRLNKCLISLYSMLQYCRCSASMSSCAWPQCRRGPGHLVTSAVSLSPLLCLHRVQSMRACSSARVCPPSFFHGMTQLQA